MSGVSLGWFGIARIGLVQASLGGIVVLATSTLNRVMVVEASLPAIVPGLLVGLHYGVQIMRPRLGYGSDVGGRRTPWIVGGMAVLALGTMVAAVATALMAAHPVAGIAAAIVGFVLIGLGVGAAGTSLLVLLASLVGDDRRAAAATIVWTMMIAGFIVTAGTAGHLLDPYSPLRLVEVTAGACGLAFVLACVAVYGLEASVPAAPRPRCEEASVPFREALAEVWAEPHSRRFALFVFVSMLAYSAQDLVLEPFAGSVFGLTPGQTTQLSGLQHGGVLVGMLLVAAIGTLFAGKLLGSMRFWTLAGCLASAVCVMGLAAAAMIGPGMPLRAIVFATGMANGAFAIAAIAAMMQLVSTGHASREGVRMGLWGGAQAVAFGLGGFSGAAVSDLGRLISPTGDPAYGAVFLGQAALFLWAAHLSVRVFAPSRGAEATTVPATAAVAGG